ncbi:MAG: hypothetical protein WBY93_00045 [Candidatus Binatus sp.]
MPTVERGTGRLTTRLLDEVGIHADWGLKRHRENADELSMILFKDYRNLPTLPTRASLQLLDGLVRKHVVPRVARAGVPLTGSRLQFSFQASEKDRLVVVGSPYTINAGRSIWGFSSDLRTESGGDFVIYLNTAHAAGAIEATLAHEMGHYIFSAMHLGPCRSLHTMMPTFAAHMSAESEMFCDSVVALIGFEDVTDACKIGLNGALGMDQIVPDIVDLQRDITPEYRIDLTNAGLSSEWRLKYLSSLIHFWKLRFALLEVTGV